MTILVTKEAVEEATSKFLGFGVGADGQGAVIIRSGSLGAFVASRDHKGRWIDAYWTPQDVDRVVDVTGKLIVCERRPTKTDLPRLVSRSWERIPRWTCSRTFLHEWRRVRRYGDYLSAKRDSQLIFNSCTVRICFSVVRD